MKTKIIPFDAKVAKDIQDGKIEGKIKTRDSKDVDELVFFVTPLEYNIFAVINGIPHSFTESGFERSWDKSGEWCGDLVLEVPDNEPQFKPFDKVLVRNDINSIWQPSIFSYHLGDSFYTVSGYPYEKENIIPYEGNENIVGTTNKPKKD